MWHYPHLNSCRSLIDMRRSQTLVSIIISFIAAIETTRESISFFSKGDLGECTTKLSIGALDDDDESVIKVENGGTHPKLSFVSSYLGFFTKAATLSKTVKITLSSEFPLIVEYEIEDIGYVKFYLAPKIED